MISIQVKFNYFFELFFKVHATAQRKNIRDIVPCELVGNKREPHYSAGCAPTAIKKFLFLYK